MKPFPRVSMLVVTALFAATAFAQPKPALVKDVDQPARSPYQETKESPSCDGSCVLQFSPVPAGKRLVLNWVNIGYIADSADSPGAASLTPGDASSTIFYFLPTSQSSTALTVFNAPVTMYVNAGASPTLTVLATTSALAKSVTGTLVGYYVSVP